MSKSEPKKCYNESKCCLPFPQPMMSSKGYPVYPFKQKGFPLFYGTINFDEKCVEISDETGIKSLQTMGFFGFHSKFRFDSNVDKKTNVLEKQKNEEQNQLKESKESTNLNKTSFNSKYFNGKYILISTSIPNALSFSENQRQDSDEKLEMKNKSLNCDQIGSDLSLEESESEKPLKLSFLESFFISYVFGSFNVFNTESNDFLTIERMWDTFCSRYSEDKFEFAVHYSAYHYFRSKGWVVRNGNSFGSHFLLYKEGPHLYHALYSVTIQYSIDGHNRQPFDWYYMSALIRLSKNVRKVRIN